MLLNFWIEKNILIESWIEKAKDGIEENSKKAWPNTPLNHQTLRFTQGPKYYKLITEPVGSRYGSVYCFIDFDGNIYKPASFQKPSKGVRGTIETVDASKLDGTCGWLYRR